MDVQRWGSTLPGMLALSVCAILGCGEDDLTRPQTPAADVRVLVEGAPIRGSNGLAFDAQDRLYVASVLGREIIVLDPESGVVLDRLGLDQGVDHPDDVAFGPDGSLYWTSFFSGEVGRISPAGQTSRMFVEPGANSITFSDDGRLFVATDFVGDALFELDPGLAAEPRRLAEGLGFLNAMDWGSDGFLYGPLWLAGQVVRVDVDDWSITPVVEGLGAPAAVKFDSQGRLHVLDTLHGEVLRVDPTIGARTVLARLAPGLDNLAFDSRGRLFVSSYADGFILEVRPDGATRTVSPGGLMRPGGVAVRPGSGGDRVFVADRFALREFDGATGQQASTAGLVFFNPGITGPLTVAADGENVILTTYIAGLVVQIWNPASGQVVQEFDDFNVPLNAIRFQGDLIVAELGSGSVIRARGADAADRIPLANTFQVPMGLAATEDDLWVSDHGSGVVLQLVADGRTLSPARAVATGLSAPEGLAVEPDGQLLVVESGARRLSRIDPANGDVSTVAEGLEMGEEEEPGAPNGNFHGVAVGSAGAIYVTGDRGAVLYRIDPAPGTPGA